MKRFITAILSVSLLLLGCQDKDKGGDLKKETVKFAVCADYAPFEYYKDGKLVGLDVELAKLLVKKLGKKAAFEDMQFGSILVSVQDGLVDAAVSAVEFSEEKAKVCDFSRTYCRAGVALVYRKGAKATTLQQLSNSKAAYQNGASDHAKLLQKEAPDAQLIAMDKMNIAIEALKAGHVDYVFMDEVPANEFCKKNPELDCSVAGELSEGYVIMLKKGSPLKAQLDKALDELESEGELKKLREKWLMVPKK
ncbi:MAG: ABC transporter substrate-binding protein [Holosporaceae bacterium]|jgi:polar amino acid transport system substrate-binding protein|nr:ABC transporter substrate-binding protein [Holosporaceae bacterium]